MEHFVTGVTARCAADHVRATPKTAVYYFHRLREINAYQLEQGADTVFSGEIEVDESYFGGKRKGKHGRGAAEKVPVFDLLKRGARSTRKLSRTPHLRLYTRSLSARWCQTALFILTVGAATTSWMYRISSTSASIIPNCLQTKRITSTELRTFGTRQSVTCAN